MARFSQVGQPDPYLFEVPVWNGSSVTTLRFSTHSISTDPADTPANTFYDGRISDPGYIDRKLFEENATRGRASVDTGRIDIIDLDGRYDPILNYGYHRVATLKVLATRNAPITGADTALRALVTGIETPDAFKTKRFILRGRMAELEKPLLTRRYLGTTVSSESAALAEGDENLAGQIVPYYFGGCSAEGNNVPGKLVNKFYNLWQFAGNELASIQMLDGGIPLANAGDFGAISSLIAAINLIPPGSYGTSLANGIAMPRSTTAKTVTAHITEGATASVRSAARVAQRIFDLVSTVEIGDIVTSTFDAFHAFNSAEIGIYIDSDRSALDVLTDVCDSVGGVILDTVDGQFEAQWLTTPSASVEATYTLRDMLDGANVQFFSGPSSEGSGAPAYSVVVNWGPIWETLGSGDLHERIAEATEGADLAAKQFLTNEKRYRSVAPAQDLTVQTAYPQAIELTFDTLLVSSTAAAAEAARRLALYKVRRDRLSFPTFLDRGDVELGRSVNVTLNRFGYQAGKNFVVLGRKDDFKRRTTTLNLWG